MGGCYSNRTAAEGNSTYYSSMSSLPLPSASRPSKTPAPTSLPQPAAKTRPLSGKRKDVSQDGRNGDVSTQRPQSTSQFGFVYRRPGSGLSKSNDKINRNSGGSGTAKTSSPSKRTGLKPQIISSKSNLNNSRSSLKSKDTSDTENVSNSLDNTFTVTSEEDANANITTENSASDNSTRDNSASVVSLQNRPADKENRTKPQNVQKKLANGRGKALNKLPSFGRFSVAKPRGPLLSKSVTTRDQKSCNQSGENQVWVQKSESDETDSKLAEIDANDNVDLIEKDNVNRVTEQTDTAESTDLCDDEDSGTIIPNDAQIDHVPALTEQASNEQVEPNIIIPESVTENAASRDTPKDIIKNESQTATPGQRTTESPFRKSKPTFKRAPIARFDSVETSSLGSINSDDLMLETDIGFDEDDTLEESHNSLEWSMSGSKSQARSYSDSSHTEGFRDKTVGGRCLSQPHSGRDTNSTFPHKSGEIGEFKYSRPRSKSGPGESVHSVAGSSRIVRRTSLPRSHGNAGAIKEKKLEHSSTRSGSVSEQNQPLEELDSLMHNTGSVLRRQKLSRSASERPASFPGPGLSDVANPRSRTGSTSSILKPPRQLSSIDDEEQYMIDGHTLRLMLQDLTTFKTMLLKVKRFLQEDELGSPFGAGPVWKNGLKCMSGSVPSSPMVFKDSTSSSMFSFTEKANTEDLTDNVSEDKTAIIEQLNQELQQSRQQLAAAQKQAEDQNRTIQLLQQQMTKYECGQFGRSGNKLVNAVTQTDKPRFPLSRSLLTKPPPVVQADDNTQVISGSSEKIPDVKGSVKGKSAKNENLKKTSKISVCQNGVSNGNAPSGIAKPKFGRITPTTKSNNKDEEVRKPVQSKLPSLRKPKLVHNM